MRKLSLLTFLSLAGLLVFSGCEKKEMETKKETEQKETSSTDDTEKEENPEKEDPGTASLQIDELFKTLTNGVLRGEKEIDVRNFNIPETKADSIYKKFLAENPLLFHLKIANNIGYITDSELPENLQAYIPMYACNPSYIQEVFPKMEKSIEKYYQQLDYRMSSAEIAYTLYQKICKEVIYGERNDEFPYLAYSAFSAVGVFLPKKAVCQGYSLSYSLLMNGIGITTDYVTGPIPGASGHMWNRVYLDGNWYHADATFDDGSSIMQNNVYSINKYFLNSDNLFYTAYKHAKPHPNLPARIYTESGNKFDSEQCVIRRYDTQSNIIKTEAMYADGSWYYLSRKK